MPTKKLKDLEFLFGIKKSTQDGKHWQIKISTKSQGVSMEEAIFHMEGWIEAIKKKMWDSRYKDMQFSKPK